VASDWLHQRFVSVVCFTTAAAQKTMLCVAIAALRRCGTRITSIEQAMLLNGVGEKTAQKVMMAVVFPAQLIFSDFN
jgi:hypothetical protein